MSKPTENVGNSANKPAQNADATKAQKKFPNQGNEAIKPATDTTKTTQNTRK